MARNGFSVSGELRHLLLGARVSQKWHQKSGLCLSRCSSITELHVATCRTMGLALFERAIVPVASHPGDTPLRFGAMDL